MDETTTRGVPERFRHLDEREGMVAVGVRTMYEVAQAVRRSLPTMDHAIRLLEEAARQLGEEGYRDPEWGPERRRLFRRDGGGWIVPIPLLEQRHVAPEPAPPPSEPAKSDPKPRPTDDAWPLPIDAPEGWRWGDPAFRPQDPQPELLPRGPTMYPGEVRVSEGPASFAVSYDATGWRRGFSSSPLDQFTELRYYGVKSFQVDTLARPPMAPPVSLLCRGDLDPAGHSIEELARWVGESKIGERVAARVRLPVPLPGGPGGCWQRICGPLREALLLGKVPAAAGWVVVDGYEGIARGHGPTLDEALAAWQAAVVEIEPLPPGSRKMAALPPPPPPPIPPEEIPEAGEYEDPEGRFKVISSGLIHVHFEAPPPSPDQPHLAWPEASPATTPAVAVPLPPAPEIPAAYRAAGYDRVVRLLGELGEVRHGFVRDFDGGCLIVGAEIADLVDPATVEEEIAATEAREAAWAATLPPELRLRWDLSGPGSSIRTYSFWDSSRRQRRAADRAGAQFAAALSLTAVDSAAAPWLVTRFVRG